MRGLDWDTIVLCLFLCSTIAGFAWRRTRIRILYYVWLVALWCETEGRKRRDMKEGARSV